MPRCWSSSAIDWSSQVLPSRSSTRSSITTGASGSGGASGSPASCSGTPQSLHSVAQDWNS